MPRAFDPGIPEDDKNPLRYGADWNDPEGIIGAGATTTAGILGQVFRDFLALDQLEAAFAEFVDAFASITWTSPDSVREAIAAAGGLIANIGRWMLTVFQHLTRLDLTEHSQFVADLIALFAFSELQAAWETFSFGWNALNWAEPLTAIHPAWMLFVDFAWAIGGWFSQLINNLLGIGMPGWFALDDLRAHWTTFFTAWGAINWTNPLVGIHSAWMALVDLGSNLWDWAMTVLRNITGIELPDFLDLDVLKDLWHAFTEAWGDINWLSLTAIWSALSAIGSLLRGVAHWAIGVFRNLTGIDLEGIAASFGITALAAALTAWATTLGGLDWGNPVEALMGAIAAFIALFQDLGNWLLGVLEAWLGWAVDAVHDMFSSVGSFVARIVEYFWGDTGLAGWIHTLESLAGEVGATITDALRAVYDGVTRFVGMFGDFTGLAGLVTFLADLFSPDGLLGWLARVRDQMTKPPVIDFGLDGIRQKLEEMFGGIPVSQINNAAVSLISQGNFNNETTIIPGDGWSWDGTTTATDTGGSAKCTADGSLQQLFSRQVAKVANGDRVDITAQVKTSGFTAAGGRYMELAIIPWKLVANVMTAQTPVVIATRTTASSGSFATLSGSTYVVANDIIRLTVRLSVVANSGAQVWFDDVSVVKTGGLEQTNVVSLIPTWNELVRGLTNPLGSPTTDKTWLDIFGASSGFRSLFNTEESKAQDLRLKMFGSPTTVGTTANLGFLPDIPRSKSADMQTIINGIWRGLRGESTEDYTAADVYNAAFYTQESVAKAKAAVAELVSKQASGDFSGVAVAVDFSTLSNSATLPSGSWDNTNTSLGSPTGSGALGISGGRAKWVTSSADNRQTISIHKTPTNSYYQMISAVFSTNINSNGAAVYLFGRSNSTGTTAVYAKFTAFKAELWKVSSGTHTRIGVNEWNVSGGDFLFYQGNTLKLQCGAVGEEDRFKVWQDGRVVINVSDASAPKAHKGTGLGADTRTYVQGGVTRQALPAEAAAFTFFDNTPSATLGSGFHIGRPGTGTQAYTTETGGAVVPASLFGSTPSRISDDLTWDNTNNKVTVSVSGWYLVTVSLRRVMTSATDRNFAAAIILNGTVHAIGQQQWNLSGIGLNATGTGSRHTSVVSMPVYIAKTEYVQAGYISNTGGDIAGPEIETYFSMAFLGNTKPVQPAAA